MIEPFDRVRVAGRTVLAVGYHLRPSKTLAQRALAGLVIAVLLHLPLAARADDLPAYRTLLADLLTQAQTAEQLGPPLRSLVEHAPTKLSLEQLERVRGVEVAGQGSVPVDIDDIAAGLRGPREEGMKAISALRLTLRALDTPAASRVDFERQTLDAVFDRPELAAAGNPVADFVQDLRQRVLRWLDELVARFKLPFLPEVRLQREGEALVWAIAAAVALFALASFGFAYLRLRNNMARYAQATDEQSALPTDAVSARLAAERAAATGDTRQAIQHLYRAAVLHLTERALLSGDRSLTNHELLRALRSRPDLASLLGVTVDIFERTWYGHGECSEMDFQQYRSNVDRVLEAAR